MSKLFKRTLLLMILLFGVIASVISIFAAYTLETKLEEEYTDKAKAITRNIATSSAEIFLNRDSSTIQSLIDQSLEIEGVSYILVSYTDGAIVSHTFAPQVPEKLRKLVHQPRPHSDEVIVRRINLPERGELLDVSSPILSGIGGYVHVGMDANAIRSYSFRSAAKMHLITFVIFLITVGIAYMLIDAISRPLLELTEYANKVAARDFSAQVDIRSDDEVGVLAKTMTNMAGEIKQRIDGLETAVQEATEEVQETLAYTAATIENLADGLFLLGARNRVIDYNPALTNILGRSTDLHGRRIDKLLGPQAAGFIERKTTELIRQYESARSSALLGDSEGEQNDAQAAGHTAELMVERADGTEFPIELTVSVVNLKGRWNTIGILRDITERKRAQQELQASRDELEKRVQERTASLTEAVSLLEQEIAERQRAQEEHKEAEAKYRSIFENAVEGIFQSTPEGRFINANPAIARIFGYDSPEELIESITDITNQLYVNPQDREDFVSLLKEQKQVTAFEALQLRKDGTKIWCRLRARPIFDERGELQFIEGILQDITERKRTEEQLLKVVKLESIGALGGGIAHDFNNLLTAILGNISYTRLCLEPGHPGRERLDQAEIACQRARGLTQQFLAFAKGGAPIKKTVAISEIVEESSQLLLRGSNVDCRIHVPSDIRAIDADPGQIGQVISNLVINAQQAMPEGGTIAISAENVTVTQEELPDLRDGAYVKISVEDQGCGIAPEHLHRIYDVYFTTKPQGSGLGLATSFVILRNHGGAITVDTRPGEGSRFDIYLPASKRKPAGSEPPQPEVVEGSGRVLVMDDEGAIRDLSMEVLGMLGYEACTAKDGEECIRQYKQAMETERPFDAVILDLTVPGGMGGSAAIKKLKEIDPKVNAIVSSGYSDDPVMANYTEHGFRGVIPKPYDVVEMSRVLSIVINHTYE